MKTKNTAAVLGIAAILSGCATSSQVQQMIDDSHADYRNQLAAHEASFGVLQKSSMAGLEMGKANAERLAAIEAQQKEILGQLQIVQGYAEASKVMSAANTVKVADLEMALKASAEELADATKRLEANDKLYEAVLMRQYQAMAETADSAIEAIRAEGITAATNAPVRLNEPIEIIAPATAPASTNPAPVNGSYFPQGKP